MRANLDYVDSREELRLAGWEVYKLSNSLEEYLKNLENKYKDIGTKLK